jgi:LacI family transcriptional regulator
MARRSLVEMGFAKTEVNLAVIAKKLGVSSSTVSRALSNAPGIHPTTQERVLSTARALGYVTDAKARAAVQSRTILMLSQAGDVSVDGAYLSGLSSASVSLNVSLISHHYRPEDCEKIMEAGHQPMALKSGDVKGVILLHRWPEKVVAHLSQSLPLVSIIHAYTGLRMDMIGIEEHEGMEELVAHLKRAGQTRIGFLGFCPQMSWARSRYGAYVEALAAQGLKFEPDNVVDVTFQEAQNEKVLEHFESAGKVFERVQSGVKAWICSSENLGNSLSREALRRGLTLSQDLFVTGFHSSTQAGHYGLPQLTSTLSSSEELGAAALRRLVTRIENPTESRRTILLPCSFRQGQTTPVV